MMANKNLLDFATTESPTSADWIHISQGGEDKKISFDNFIEAVNGGNPFNISVKTESSNARVLTISDRNSYITCLDNVQTTILLQNTATHGWKNGDSIILQKGGNGNVLFNAASGVTIKYPPSGVALTEVNQAGQLLCFDAANNIWHLLTGGNARASLTGQASFLSVAALKAGVTVEGVIVDFSILAAQNSRVSTVYNNTTSNKGGAQYIIKTLAQAVTDGDLIDGTGAPYYKGKNHQLDATHCAILQAESGVFKAESFGMNNPSGDDTEALDSIRLNGGVVVCEKDSQYFYSGSSVYSDKSLILNLNGSTITRTANSGAMFATTANNIVLMNGVLDNDYFTSNFAHLFYINSIHTRCELINVQMYRNVAGGATPTPTVSIDSDLLYVQLAKEVIITNCKFQGASRNGVSFVSACPSIKITGSTFEDCYLFGVDIEPNSSTTFMFPNVFINDNTFINNGRKSATNYVWNSGGPFACASGSSAVTIVKDLTFTNNIIISDDFPAPLGGGIVAPFMKFEQFDNLIFHNNKIANIERVLFATSNAACAIGSVDIKSSSAVSENGGGFYPIWYSYNSERLKVSGCTEIGGFVYSTNSGPVGFIDNSFKNAVSAIKANDARPTKVTISSNDFDSCTTAIDTTNKSTDYVVVANNSSGDTTFIGAVTSSQVCANNYDGVNVNGQISVSSNTVGYDAIYESPNGWVSKFVDGRGSSSLNDVYGQNDYYSADVTAQGVVARFDFFKDVTNASAYSGFRVWTGLVNATKNNLYVSFAGHLLPSYDVAQDNTQNVGSATVRWKEMFAGNGTINTSDEREKTTLEEVSDQERLAAIDIKSSISKFKMLDSVEEKGELARIHFGVGAQTVAGILAAHGLDPWSYSFMCRDDLDGGGERYGIRYDQLCMFILSAI